MDSANKHGILLEVVQILTDLNLVITKAYISSDGGWFMDGNHLCLYFSFHPLSLRFLKIEKNVLTGVCRFSKSSAFLESLSNM